MPIRGWLISHNLSLIFNEILIVGMLRFGKGTKFLFWKSSGGGLHAGPRLRGIDRCTVAENRRQRQD